MKDFFCVSSFQDSTSHESRVLKTVEKPTDFSSRKFMSFAQRAVPCAMAFVRLVSCVVFSTLAGHGHGFRNSLID